MFSRKKLDGFVVNGNIIQWTFYGKDQKSSGNYSLELVVNEDKKGMITTDACDFVNLVSCSCQLNGGEDAPNVEMESIELTSTLEYVAGGGSTPDLSEYLTKIEAEETYQPKGDYVEVEMWTSTNMTMMDSINLNATELSQQQKSLTELSQEVEDLKNAGSGGVTDEQIEDAIGLMIPHDCNNDFNTDFAI
jgi:hypothetical protein